MPRLWWRRIPVRNGRTIRKGHVQFTNPWTDPAVLFVSFCISESTLPAIVSRWQILAKLPTFNVVVSELQL
jgi:hypothetical protein